METCQSINQRLIDLYGIDTDTGQAMLRIGGLDDQYEKRLMDVLTRGYNLYHCACDGS